MKTVSSSIFNWLMIVLALGLFLSCGSINPEVPTETPDEPNVPETPETPVSPEISPDSTWVTFKPELEFGEEPLVKGGNALNDLYIIGIAQIVPFEDMEGWKNICYKRYAWGYFDNLDLAVFKLSKMHNYSFVMAYIPDGKNLIYRHSDNTYGCPCEIWGGGAAKTLNEIDYNVEGYEKWPTLDEGKCSTRSRKEGKAWSSIVRYQGVAERINPAENSSVPIKLYRMMIGFKITIDDFMEGYIEVSGGGESYKLYPSNNGTTNTLEFEIQTPNMPMWGFNSGFGAGGEVYSEDEYNGYSQELKNRILDNINYGRAGINISYVDKKGSKISLYTKQQFIYKRNTKYTLRFSLADAISNGGIIPEVVEEGEMEEEPLLQ